MVIQVDATSERTTSASFSRRPRHVRMVSVLQFCAMCCVTVACHACADSHANGHIHDDHREHDGGGEHGVGGGSHDKYEERYQKGGDHGVGVGKDTQRLFPTISSTSHLSVVHSDSPRFTVYSTTNGSSVMTNFSSSEDEDRIWVANAKYTSMPVIFLLTLMSSYLPWYIRRLARAVDVLTIGACVTAGVILGAGLSHLMVDSMESFDEYYKMIDTESYPASAAIAGAVLLVLVWVDAIMVRRGMSTNDGCHHGHAHGTAGSFVPAQLGHSHMVPELPDEYHDLERKIAMKKKETQKTTTTTIPQDLTISSIALPTLTVSVAARGQTTTSSVVVDADTNIMHTKTIGTVADNHTTVAEDITLNTSNNTLSMESEETKLDKLRGSKKHVSRAIVFLAALSLHSIFDGLSIGAETEKDKFSALLIAVGGHKALDGFALGIPVFFAKWSNKGTAAVLIFAAMMTPMGIGISMAATESTQGSSQVLTRAIILSMSLGSFLFISLVELLPAGLDNGKLITEKMIGCVLGWGLMVVLAAYV